jgi:hypothetical protein
VDLTTVYLFAVKKLIPPHPQDGKSKLTNPMDLIANASHGKKFMSKNLKPP